MFCAHQLKAPWRLLSWNQVDRVLWGIDFFAIRIRNKVDNEPVVEKIDCGKEPARDGFAKEIQSIVGNCCYFGVVLFVAL